MREEVRIASKKVRSSLSSREKMVAVVFELLLEFQPSFWALAVQLRDDRLGEIACGWDCHVRCTTLPHIWCIYGKRASHASRSKSDCGGEVKRAYRI